MVKSCFSNYNLDYIKSWYEEVEKKVVGSYDTESARIGNKSRNRESFVRFFQMLLTKGDGAKK